MQIILASASPRRKELMEMLKVPNLKIVPAKGEECPPEHARPEELVMAYDEVTEGDGMRAERRWVINNYDPYLDGQVGHRMLEGARDYIRRHGVPKYRKVNLWRKYTSIKGFGRINRH